MFCVGSKVFWKHRQLFCHLAHGVPVVICEVQVVRGVGDLGVQGGRGAFVPIEQGGARLSGTGEAPVGMSWGPGVRGTTRVAARTAPWFRNRGPVWEVHSRASSICSGTWEGARSCILIKAFSGGWTGPDPAPPFPQTLLRLATGPRSVVPSEAGRRHPARTEGFVGWRVF